MPDPPDEEVPRELARLRDDYLRKLPARLQELEGLVREGRASGARAPLEAARDLAHTLHGSSGFHGLADARADLQLVEEDLEQRLGAAPVRAGWGAVERAFDRIRQRLAAETSSG